MIVKPQWVKGKFQRTGSLCSQADVAGLRNNAIPQRDRLYRTPKNVVRKVQASSLAFQFQKQVEGAAEGVRNIRGEAVLSAAFTRCSDSCAGPETASEIQRLRKRARNTQPGMDEVKSFPRAAYCSVTNGFNHCTWSTAKRYGLHSIWADF